MKIWCCSNRKGSAVAESFVTLRDKMRTWLAVDADRLANAAAGDCLNLAHKELSRKYDGHWNEVLDSFATAANDRDYALPAGYRTPLTFWYIDPDTDAFVELQRVEKDTFDALFPDATVTSAPSHYTVWGSALYLGPTPDGVYTIWRNYYRIVADLTEANPTGGLIPDHWDVVFFGGLVHATRYLLEDARAPLWEAQYRRLESDLVSQQHRERSAARVPQSREPG